MDTAVWYFGLLHLLLYAGMGVSFVIYNAFRILPGIAKTIWQHRDDVVPRYEQQ